MPGGEKPLPPKAATLLVLIIILCCDRDGVTPTNMAEKRFQQLLAASSDDEHLAPPGSLYVGDCESALHWAGHSAGKQLVGGEGGAG